MGRRLRQLQPGLTHHVYNHAVLKDDLYQAIASRRRVLGLAAQFEERYAIRIHAYAVMSNHFHLVLTDEEGVLPEAMRWLQCESARQVNRLDGEVGARFRSRYHNNVVENDEVLAHILAYVLANPPSAGMVAELYDPLWSSYSQHVGEDAWVDNDLLWSLFADRQSLDAVIDEIASYKGGLGHLRRCYRQATGQTLGANQASVLWLKQQGLTILEIAELIRSSPRTTRRLLKQAGGAPRSTTCLWRR